MRFISRTNIAIAVTAWMLLAGCESAMESQSLGEAKNIECAPRASGAAGLPGEWQPFAVFIDECPVGAPREEPALRVIAVSARRFYARQPDGATTVEMPKPLIVSADGRTLGRLPYNYPDDPPFSCNLQFDDWKDGLPQRIRITVKDPTVTGDHERVMTWDEPTQQYIAAK